MFQTFSGINVYIPEFMYINVYAYIFFITNRITKQRLCDNLIFTSSYYNESISQGQYKSVPFLMTISLNEQTMI